MADLEYDTKVHKPLNKNLSDASSGYGSIRNSTISTSSRDSRIGSCSTQWHVFEEQSSTITGESTYHNTKSTEEEYLSASPESQMFVVNSDPLPRKRSSAFDEDSEIKSKCKAKMKPKK